MADSPGSAGTPYALAGSAQFGAGQMEDYGLRIQSSSPPYTVMTTVQTGWSYDHGWNGGTALATKVAYQTGGRVSFLTATRLKLA